MPDGLQRGFVPATIPHQHQPSGVTQQQAPIRERNSLQVPFDRQSVAWDWNELITGSNSARQTVNSKEHTCSSKPVEDTQHCPSRSECQLPSPVSAHRQNAIDDRPSMDGRRRGRRADHVGLFDALGAAEAPSPHERSRRQADRGDQQGLLVRFLDTGEDGPATGHYGAGLTTGAIRCRHAGAAQHSPPPASFRTSLCQTRIGHSKAERSKARPIR